ncbi:MAG TPA: hypothetical protein VM681_06150 [Candidatus Thermoplasmatota archaeon]|nr:hypothetical protein [Candidatus Thermoplasmatota archaeon]
MADLDLATLANVAEILGLATIVGGVLFAGIQLRNFRMQRRDAVVIPLVQCFQEPHLAASLRRVLSLPDSADPATIEADPDLLQAAEAINYTMESWGIIVFERSTDLHTLDRACGGIVRTAWRKLGPFVASRRQRYDNPAWGEWFQWLAERLSEHPAPGKDVGAHVAFRDWRP